MDEKQSVHRPKGIIVQIPNTAVRWIQMERISLFLAGMQDVLHAMPVAPLFIPEDGAAFMDVLREFLLLGNRSAYEFRTMTYGRDRVPDQDLRMEFDIAEENGLLVRRETDEFFRPALTMIDMVHYREDDRFAEARAFARAYLHHVLYRS